MSRTRLRDAGKAPYFTATVDVDVDIDPDELEDAGWVYVGEGKTKPEIVNEVLATVQRWHDDTHPGPFCYCNERPCVDLRDELDVAA